MSRKCRSCENIIPNRITVDGKVHVTKNRKFCTECSPFKMHNTNPISPNTRKTNKWSEFSEKRKNANKMSFYKRGLERRAYLYEKSGGKCSICGYCKNSRALSFHHLDSNSKRFGLSLNELWSRTIEEIEIEWRKCQLLCLNCHAEIEDEISRKTSIVKLINEKYKTSF